MRLFGGRGNNGDHGLELGLPLTIPELVGLMMAALAPRDLEMVLDPESSVVRICGRPGSIDFGLVTNVHFVDDGILSLECYIPVLISEERLDAALELCLWLSSEGHASYSIDRGRPFVRTCEEFRHGCEEWASFMVDQMLGVLWGRAAGYESVFRDVADGLTAAEAVTQLRSTGSSDAELVPDFGPWQQLK